MALSPLSKLVGRYIEPVLSSKIAVPALKRVYKAWELRPKFGKQVPPITVFRGVFKDHPRFFLAKEGIVVPRNPLGTASIDLHNDGTSNSALTSWTRNRAIAETHADVGGIVLEADIDGNRIQWSPDIWYEEEVLVRGLVCGAKVWPVKALKTGNSVGSDPKL